MQIFINAGGRCFKVVKIEEVEDENHLKRD